jgi:cob(I)alamin adenosyltransferase
MKVYTKTGDKGTTALISGKRVPKYHIRIEAYGTVDELMAYTGLLYDTMENDYHKKNLLTIQDRLMVCATILAADCTDCKFELPVITDSDIEFLEKEIDKIQNELSPLKSFILSGGHTVSSYCHIARTVCRRAERLAIQVNETEGNTEYAVKYLNRLSDYFFVLARKILKELNFNEIHWLPRS